MKVVIKETKGMAIRMTEKGKFDMIPRQLVIRASYDRKGFGSISIADEELGNMFQIPAFALEQAIKEAKAKANG